MMDREGKSLFIILLRLFYIISFTNAQSQSCPLITVNNLGSTNKFSTDRLVARSIIPLGDTSQSTFVRIVDFNKVCNASGD